MKKVLFGLALLMSSTAAWAEPIDSDLMTEIDIGSTLTIQQNINIPAHMDIDITDGKLRSIGGFDDVDCTIGPRRNDGTYDHDVEIASGSILTLTANEPFENTDALYFKTQSGNIVLIECMDGHPFGGPVPSIGKLKQALNGLAILTFKKPESI